MNQGPRNQRFNLRRLLDPAPLSVALIWGGNFVAYKIVLKTVSPLAVVGTRFGLLTPVLLIATHLLGRRPRPARQDWLCLIWAGLVIMGGQQITFIKALHMTSATEGALLITSAPIFTAIIAVLLRQERLSRLNWLGVFLGFAGVALVVLGGAKLVEARGTHLPGNMLMLASAMLYGYFMVLSKHLVELYGGLPTVAYSYAFASLLVLPVSARDLVRTPWFFLDALTWVLLVGYICLLAGVYGFTVWYTTIGRAGASATAVYQYLVPVVAMASAAAFLHEQPRAIQLFGAAIVLAGLALSRHSRLADRIG
jgi:drug/metabolite transporter (DMT)-like permease